MKDCVIDGLSGKESEFGRIIITCNKVQCLEGSHWVGSGGPTELFFGAKYLNDLTMCPDIKDMEAAVLMENVIEVFLVVDFII
jgi:hypothetical protein